ncbi:MAG: DUF507 family protein [Nitrospinota bacterium]
MRVSMEMVDYLAEKVVSKLLEKNKIELDCTIEAGIEVVKKAMLEDLQIEDRLEEEVKELLNKHEGKFDSEGIDYRKMFTMIKGKLIRERELIL